MGEAKRTRARWDTIFQHRWPIPVPEGYEDAPHMAPWSQAVVRPDDVLMGLSVAECRAGPTQTDGKVMINLDPQHRRKGMSNIRQAYREAANRWYVTHGGVRRYLHDGMALFSGGALYRMTFTLEPLAEDEPQT